MASQSSAGFEALMYWLGLVILLLVIEFILVEVRNFSRLRLVDETGVNLQKEMYLHTARMDLTFFERSGSLNNLFRASSGGGNGAFGPIQSALAAFTGIVQIISLFGLMVYLQPLLASMLFIAGVPMLLIRSLSAIEKYNLDVSTTQRRRLSRYFTSRLSGAENVLATKILGLADEMIERFEKTARSVILEKREILKKISFRLGISVLFYLTVLIIVAVWLSYRFSLGEVEVRSYGGIHVGGIQGSAQHRSGIECSGVWGRCCVIDCTAPRIPAGKAEDSRSGWSFAGINAWRYCS